MAEGIHLSVAFEATAEPESVGVAAVPAQAPPDLDIINLPFEIPGEAQDGTALAALSGGAHNAVSATRMGLRPSRGRTRPEPPCEERSMCNSAVE